MRIRNISGQDLEVPVIGRMVPADAVTEVPDHLAESFLAGYKTWEAAEPADEDAPPPKRQPKAKE